MSVQQVLRALQENRVSAGMLMKELEKLNKEQVELLRLLDEEKTQEYERQVARNGK